MPPHNHYTKSGLKKLLRKYKKKLLKDGDFPTKPIYKLSHKEIYDVLQKKVGPSTMSKALKKKHKKVAKQRISKKTKPKWKSLLTQRRRTVSADSKPLPRPQ